MKKRKKTGELELYKEIWEERNHECSICEVALPNLLRPIYFSHIISKGSEPKGRLDKENIWLKCHGCHSKYEFGDLSNPIWNDIKEKKMELKLKYSLMYK